MSGKGKGLLTEVAVVEVLVRVAVEEALEVVLGSSPEQGLEQLQGSLVDALAARDGRHLDI